MSQYTIDLQSTDILVGANYDSGFTAIDTIDFGSCTVNFTTALSGNANLTAVTNATVVDSDITALFMNDVNLSNISGVVFSGVQIAVSAFATCTNLDEVDLSYSKDSLVDLGNAFRGAGIKSFSMPEAPVLTDANRAFMDTPNLTSVTIDLSRVTNAEGIFGNKSGYTKALNWNVGSDLSNIQIAKEFFGTGVVANTTFEYSMPSVTNTDGMFKQSNFTDVKIYNTSALTDCHLMFAGCQSLTSVTMDNLSAVTSGTNMFSGCSQVTSCKLGHLPAGQWDFTAMPLDDESTTYIATNAETVTVSASTNLTSTNLTSTNLTSTSTSTGTGTGAGTSYIRFNSAVSANTNYYQAYVTLTGKGWTVSPEGVNPSVAQVKFTDIDGTGADGISATEA